ncbi:MAG TPA: YdeI/OmpD-associated family protein [Paludibacter sp.]|nr:YdeI/OmpD-associated family protein [Paludibacter sp.]
MEQPLVDKLYQLEKFPGKGGWTYAVIPEVLPDKHAHFGWVRVKGSIDSHQFRNYHLMPMGNGSLFLPVKAAVRKAIGKQAGDQVHVVLYADNAPTEIPEELRLCLDSEPGLYKAFLGYPDGEQKACIEWIYSARTEETKVERIARTMDKLAGRQRLQG